MHFPPGVRRSRGPGFWERPSRPRYSPFRGPASPSPAVFPAAKRRLYQGPPRATKVQQLLIFGVPPSPGEAAQGGGGLLPTSVRQGGSARFSPDFRASARKRDRQRTGSGCFPFFEGCFPTCYVDLVNCPLAIGNTPLFSPDFLCRSPPAAISLPQNSREAR